jgi:WD40 repeat protein
MKTHSILIFIFICFTLNISAQQLSVQTGHSSTILDLKYSPDGNYLFSTGVDNKIIIWDLRSSKQMNILSGHNAAVNSITFHPFKNIVASASDDKTVKIWEYPSGNLLENYNFFTEKVKSLDFNSDGTKLACASDSIYIIDLVLNTYKTIPLKAKRIYTAVNYGHLDRYIAFGGKKESKLHLYNIEKGRITKSFRNRTNQIYIDKEDKYVYCASNNGKITRYPISTASIRRKMNLAAERSWYSFYSVDANDKYLFAGNKNGLIYVYNKRNGKRKFILKGHEGEIKAVTVNPSGDFLASAGNDKKIVIWDIEQRKIAKVLQGGTGSINSLSFSNDGKRMFIAYDNSDFRIWDLAKKGDVKFGSCPDLNFIEKYSRKNYFVQNSTYKINDNNIIIKADLKKTDKRTDDFLSTYNELLILEPDSNMRVTTLKSKYNTEYQSFQIMDTSRIMIFKTKSTHSQKYSVLNREKIRDREQVFYTSVYVEDINNLKKHKKLEPHTRPILNIKGDLYYKGVSDNGKYLTVLIDKKNNNSVCEVYDIETLNKILTLDFNTLYQAAGFSPSGKYVYLTSDNKDSILIYETIDARNAFQFIGRSPITFTDDEKICLFTDFDKKLHIYDMDNRKELYNIKTNHVTKISTIKINPEYNYVATAGHDGLIKFWNFKTGENLVGLAAFSSSDYMYVTEDNYYFSTGGSMEYINFSLNDRLYSFDQFDVKFNRPDIVLSKLPYSTKAEINAYHKAYEKRMKKMGFNMDNQEESFVIPQVSLKNMSDFQISTLVDSLRLVITAKDSVYNLSRINVWVNDIPIYGEHGKDLSQLFTKVYYGEHYIKLSPGRNKIQISAVNYPGYESLKETIYIDLDQKEKKPDLYLVSIGVSTYETKAFNLEYAAKDAMDISNLFKSNNKYYDKIHNINITDSNAVKDVIMKAKDELMKSKINDVVIVFFAGHGLLSSDMDYYLGTYDINFYFPEEKGMKYEELESLLNEIPARKKMLLIDACHSGEVDADEAVVDAENPDNLGGDGERAGDQKILSQSAFELMKHMFADIRKGSGSTVISSAGGAEYAYESAKTKNGIFTYIFIKGITEKKADLNKDGKIMVSEMRDYLMENVSKMTNGYQNPTCRRQNMEFDFVIW